MLLRLRVGFDESLDAWAIHGMGGFWGAIATGIFASTAINKYPGLLEGSTTQFVANVTAACVTVVFAFVVTYAIAWVVKKSMGLRVTEEEEYVGLDIAQHGERVPQ
jgi:Amt family ammonium transporter